MIVSNKIWEEIKQADVCVKYALDYTSRQRTIKKYIEISIAVVSAIGVFGYLINKLIPFISLLVISIGSIVKSIYPQCIQPEKELCEIDSLIEFYERYKNNLEKIYYELQEGIKDEQSIYNDFHKLKDVECEKRANYNKLIYKTSKKHNKKAIEKSEEDLVQTYLDKYEKQ